MMGKSFMAQIFVSHSQYDKEIRASFDTVFARTGVKSVCMEFEQIYPPAWQRIKDEKIASEAIFLLLGPNIRSSIHTQNWIAFEVGLACAFRKEVWVFEQAGSYIEFPIPYLTDYMIYNLEDSNHFDYVRGIAEGYGKPIYIFPLGVDHRTKRNIPIGILVKCPYENCKSSYSLHTNVKSFNCPSCRQTIRIPEASI
jgi:hypothetical protein